MVGGSKKNKMLMRLGLLLIGASLAFLSFIFGPMIREEIRYLMHKSDSGNAVLSSTLDEGGDRSSSTLVNEDIIDFGIVIPKIDAVAPIIEDVDPFEESSYQQALREGIAHAKGTNLPGQKGNTFLFAHSSANFYDVGRYNTAFYLLNKLEVGDHIYTLLEGRVYKYEVRDTIVVSSNAVEYLEKSTTSDRTLTLMTCWPPGTLANRLLVSATLVDEYDFEEGMRLEQ